MSRKERFCYLCGKSCFGHTCRDCYNDRKHRSLAKINAGRKRYAKQI